jgi:hypothetical protein
MDVFSCASDNMVCELPGPPGGQLIDDCVNECGGRGVALSGHQCDMDPALPCGYLVCDTTTGTLQGDHTACLGGGLTCTEAQQCKSCVCLNNVCIGSDQSPCPGSACSQ